MFKLIVLATVMAVAINMSSAAVAYRYYPLDYPTFYAGYPVTSYYPGVVSSPLAYKSEDLKEVKYEVPIIPAAPIIPATPISYVRIARTSEPHPDFVKQPEYNEEPQEHEEYPTEEHTQV